MSTESDKEVVQQGTSPEVVHAEKPHTGFNGDIPPPQEQKVYNLHDAAAYGTVATDKYGNPIVQFDPEAEKRLRRKIDIFIVPTVALLYLFCFIDRANIGNARLAGFEADLKLSAPKNEYNVVLSVFYISYIIFEIPCNIACKYFGPGWFLPATSLAFGIVSIATAFVNDLSGACGVRFLLGIFEAGMLPGIAYYLSRWYRRKELAFRLSMYMVMAPLAGAFGGLLASGILTLDHFGSVSRWRMIFAIEGVITIGLAVISFFTLTDRPATARWLTQEEKDLAEARVKSERVATTAVLDKIDLKKLLAGVFNPATLTTSFAFLMNNITVQGLAFFLPTIVAGIYPQKSTVEKQLFTVPPYVVGAFFVMFIPFISSRIDKRQLFIIASAPGVMIGYCMFLGSRNNSVRYAATFLIASSAFILGPMTNAHISANVVSDTARTAAIGTNVMFGNIGGLIATWSFLSTDAPHFPIGNGLNLAASSLILISASLALAWFYKDNKKREGRNIDEELAGLTDQQIQDLDWKHPSFRWRP